MRIVMTSDADYVYCEFNGLHGEWDDAKLKRSSVRSVCKCKNDGGVEIIFTSGSDIILHYLAIESIDGDTAITSNDILRNKLRNLMKI